MNADNSKNEEQQVADLAQRIQGLESELTEARAQLIGVHSRLLYARQSFYADEHTEGTIRSGATNPQSRAAQVQEEDQAPIHIEPLPIHHPLRRKWSLGKGLPGSTTRGTGQRISFVGNHVPGGMLRLFSLLANGEPWEQLISFSELAKEGGIIIGRDPETVHLQLPENGVSRMHARIELGSTGLVISDLNSTNGIQVNDDHINSYSPQVPINDGTIIRLGDTALRVEIIYGSAEPITSQNNIS